MSTVIAGMNEYTEDIQGLRAELSRLLREIEDAVEVGDMDRWNELQFHAQSLPHEIRRMEAAQLRAKMAQYEEEVDRLTAEIDALTPELGKAHAAYERAKAKYEDLAQRVGVLTEERRSQQWIVRDFEQDLRSVQNG
ncbi:MAG: hypothetical protein M3Q29_21620 [Chloroflexota bacterium]|nr:hypothetical protein [Chloroflexota bacterium]